MTFADCSRWERKRKASLEMESPPTAALQLCHRSYRHKELQEAMLSVLSLWVRAARRREEGMPEVVRQGSQMQRGILSSLSAHLLLC